MGALSFQRFREYVIHFHDHYINKELLTFRA